MLDITNTRSLTDFNRNTREHVERLKQTGKELLTKAEFADAVKAIRLGMKAHAQGRGKEMRKALEEIAAEVGLSLE